MMEQEREQLKKRKQQKSRCVKKEIMKPGMCLHIPGMGLTGFEPARVNNSLS